MTIYPPVVTTPFFWDCECETGYMHPATEDKCIFCDATRENSPDSHLNEVIMMLVRDWYTLSGNFPLDFPPDISR